MHLAQFAIRDAVDGKALFEVVHESGDLSPDERQLLEDVRRALFFVQDGLAPDGRADLLERLRKIADLGLVVPDHSPRDWVNELQIILRNLDPDGATWVHGKYFSAALTKDKDGLPDLTFYKQIGDPTREYFDFIARMNELGFGLKFMLDAAPTHSPRHRSSLRAVLSGIVRKILKSRLPEGTRSDSNISNKIDQTRARFENYLERIALLGATALGRDEITAATTLLTNLELEIIRREGPRVKNAYVLELGRVAFPFFVGFSAIYALVRMYGGPTNSDPSVLVRFREFFILLAGCSVGTWLSYRIRSQKFSNVADLVELESDQLSPINRVLFSIGLTTVIGLIFQSQLVTIAVNQFTSNFQYNGVRALLIGMLCGVSEIALGDVVGRRAKELLDQAAPTAQR